MVVDSWLFLRKGSRHPFPGGGINLIGTGHVSRARCHVTNNIYNNTIPTLSNGVGELASDNPERLRKGVKGPQRDDFDIKKRWLSSIRSRLGLNNHLERTKP